jgi:hypothetical protein
LPEFPYFFSLPLVDLHEKTATPVVLFQMKLQKKLKKEDMVSEALHSAEICR